MFFSSSSVSCVEQLNYLPYSRELDELEREDFTRLKKVQANKAEAQKIADAEKALQEVDLAASPGAGDSSAVMSGFDAADDPDVVFK